MVYGLFGWGAYNIDNKQVSIILKYYTFIYNVFNAFTFM